MIALPAGLGLVAAGAESGPPTLMFDPTRTDSSITLSGGNLVATGNANSGGQSKAMLPKSTGKWYAEVVLNSFSSAGTNGLGIVGIATDSEPLSNYLGQGTGCAALWRVGSQGRTYLAGGSSNVSPLPTGSDRLMLAWDADAGNIWFGRNGTWYSGDPATGTGPTYSDASLEGLHYLASGPRNSGNQVTLSVSPTYSVPSGFSYWA